MGAAVPEKNPEPSKWEIALGKAKDLIGAVSGVYGYFSTVKGILDQLFGSDSDALKEAVQKVIQTVEADLDALDKTLQMLAVHGLINDAEVQLDRLKHLWPDDPEWPKVEGDVLGTQKTVHTLADEEYWKRPFFSSLVYSNKWTTWSNQDMSPPRLDDGRVFDYRITLPAFLESISIYLTVQVALEKNYRAIIVDEVKRCADALQWCYDNMCSGFREIEPPSYDTLHCLDPGAKTTGPLGSTINDAKSAMRNFWMLSRHFGVVQTHSGASIVDQWDAGDPAFANTWAVYDEAEQRIYDTFRIRHLIRTMSRSKRLYNALGLPDVAATIKELQSLAGAVDSPVVAAAKSLVSRPRGDWSVRELASRLQSLTLSGGKKLAALGPLGQVSVRALLKQIPVDPKLFWNGVPSLRSAVAD